MNKTFLYRSKKWGVRIVKPSVDTEEIDFFNRQSFCVEIEFRKKPKQPVADAVRRGMRGEG